MANIKIIDDDIEFAENVQLILQQQGHTVSVRIEKDGAIEELKRDKPDLLILDVMFPDNPSGGFDLAREIRSTPEIEKLPIILLTGVNQQFPMDFSAEDKDPEWMPVQDFVEKPVDFDLLNKKVSELL